MGEAHVMRVEGREFSAKLGAPEFTGEPVFRFCNFEGLEISGGGSSGILEGCVGLDAR